MSSARPTPYAFDPANDPDAGRPWARREARFTILKASTPRADPSIELSLVHASGGLMVTRPSPDHRIFLHVGAPVPTTCGGYGAPRKRLAQTGDIDVIPAGGGGFWIDEAPALSLKMTVAPALLDRVGRETGRRLPILEPEGPLRDAGIEPIGWALKSELDEGEPGGRLYVDSLALALAARLLGVFGEAARPVRPVAPLSRRRMGRVIDYIEAHLEEDLSLERIAEVACLSPSHFKAAFRQAANQPLHQYVIRRRVDRARQLLAEGRASISEVALEVGFAHHSHLARWTRRLLGATPRELAA